MVGFPLWPNSSNRTFVVLVNCFTVLLRVLTLWIRRFPFNFLTVGPYDTAFVLLVSRAIRVMLIFSCVVV